MAQHAEQQQRHDHDRHRDPEPAQTPREEHRRRSRAGRDDGQDHGPLQLGGHDVGIRDFAAEPAQQEPQLQAVQCLRECGRNQERDQPAQMGRSQRPADGREFTPLSPEERSGQQRQRHTPEHGRRRAYQPPRSPQMPFHRSHRISGSRTHFPGRNFNDSTAPDARPGMSETSPAGSHTIDWFCYFW